MLLFYYLKICNIQTGCNTHISKEEFCYVACIIYLLAWYQVSHLAKPIQNHKNRVKSPLGLG